jgi:HlyD family secretion protein
MEAAPVDPSARGPRPNVAEPRPSAGTNGGASGAPTTPVEPTNGAARARLIKDLSRQEGGFKWLRRLLILLVIAAAIGGYALYRVKNAPPPPPQFVLAELSTGDITETVQSTGQVKPVLEVQVGAQVSGRVTQGRGRLQHAREAGDVLAEIDPIAASARRSSPRRPSSSRAAQRPSAAPRPTWTLRRSGSSAPSAWSPRASARRPISTRRKARTTWRSPTSPPRARRSRRSTRSSSRRRRTSSTRRSYSPIDGVVINRSIDSGADRAGELPGAHPVRDRRGPAKDARASPTSTRPTSGASAEGISAEINGRRVPRRAVQGHRECR